MDLFPGKILYLINYVYGKRIHLHEMQIILASLENMGAIKTVLPPFANDSPIFIVVQIRLRVIFDTPIVDLLSRLVCVPL